MGGVNYKQSGSSQLQSPRNLFLGASTFMTSGTTTLTRTGKGIWATGVAASLTAYFAADLGQALRDYVSALVNYQPGINPNAAISLNSITAIYSVTGAALTTATVGVSQSLFPVSGVAATPTVTDLIAPTALTLPVSADIYSVPVYPANPAILALSQSQILAEVEVVTPASSAFALYGLLLNFMYDA